MRLLPTSVFTMDDWLVDVEFTPHEGKRQHKTIGASRHLDEAGALYAVANSIRRRYRIEGKWQSLYPEIHDMKARRRKAIWQDSTASRHPSLIERFIKT